MRQRVVGRHREILSNLPTRQVGDGEVSASL
jgi:hypothetical protein